MDYPTVKLAFYQSFKGIALNLPVLISVILIAGIFEIFITPEMLSSLFSGQALYDTLMGTISGAISVGHPFISYLIGVELLDSGMSYYAVTAFVLSWVTLGVVHLPFIYWI